MVKSITRRESIIASAATLASCAVSQDASGAPVRHWTSLEQSLYAKYMKEYVQSYKMRIDCADLAIFGLIGFANKRKLPIRLFDYQILSKRWFQWKPGAEPSDHFAKMAARELGAANLIENTLSVSLKDIRAGDLIMSEYNSADSTGHTRIVVSTEWDPKQQDWWVTWFQGTLPPTIPERRHFHYKDMPNPHKVVLQPRRWNFTQFDAQFT